MKRISTIILIALMVCGVVATAQMPEPRKPGTEEKNLAYFVGNWKMDGDLKAGPMGPGGKFTGTERDEWLPGDFYLVSHSEGSSPMGNEIALAIIGYDPAKKVYTYDAYNNMGQAEHATGAFDGTTWTWNSDMNMGGKNMKGRFIIKETSPTSYDFKFEMSEDGNTWTSAMDGKASKAGAGAATRKK
ncbi:MAG TPA: DUF1579 family protein [Candidatus Solibacter sp.]|jgi:hypothetical protein|nr:DUF1579 family protein [Candidatus Solibacter sp.]